MPRSSTSLKGRSAPSSSGRRLKSKASARRRKIEVSAARLSANRRNALKSTGPRTIEGKSRSRRNALKHGLCAIKIFPDKPVPIINSPVLPGECSATFETIKGELYEEFHPRTAAEYWMIDRIAEQMWRLMRANAMEREQFEQEAHRMAIERHEDVSDANGEDAMIRPLTPAMVMLSLFSRDESHPMMRIVRVQQSANSTVLRMFSRLQALRKRPNEDLYSKQDVDAFKYPGHSETFRKTGWPDMSDRKPNPPGTVGQADRGTTDSVDGPSTGTSGCATVGLPTVPTGQVVPGARLDEPTVAHNEEGVSGTVGQADRGTVGAPERTHFERPSEASNPLWQAANAVPLPDLDSAPDGTKPLEEEKARAA